MDVLYEKLWTSKKPVSNIVFIFTFLFVENIKIRFSIGPFLYSLKGELLQKDVKNATFAHISLKQHKANGFNDMLH